MTSVEVKSNYLETVQGTLRSVLGLYGQASRLISTRKLNALLHFHTVPINHLVLMVPLGESSSREISSWGVLPA